MVTDFIVAIIEPNAQIISRRLFDGQEGPEIAPLKAAKAALRASFGRSLTEDEI